MEVHTPIFLGSPGDSDGEESSCNAVDVGSIPELGRSPGEGNSNPLQYSCLETPDGQRSLADYSPWPHKESDTTEQLTTEQHTFFTGSNYPPFCIVNTFSYILKQITVVQYVP